MNRKWTSKLYEQLKGKTLTPNVCARCGQPLHQDNVTIEHMIPRTDKGPNAKYNLCLLCETCNTDKGDVLYDNALESYPYLRKPYQVAYNVMLVSFSDILRELEVVSFENVGIAARKD